MLDPTSSEPPMLPIPDLLHHLPQDQVDPEALRELLELSYLGREAAERLDRALLGRPKSDDWDLDHFAEDLFVRQVIHEHLAVESDGLRFPVHEDFLFQVLSAPPTTAAGVSFRQDILRELDTRPELERAAHRLYRECFRLLDMFRAPDQAAKLDAEAFRLDILRQARSVIDSMVDDFADARSGLSRLYRTGLDIQATDAYRRLRDLLDWESRQSSLTVRLAVGADGRIRDLELLETNEHRENPHWTPLWKRVAVRLGAVATGQKLDHRAILSRLLRRVFEQVAPALVPLVQVLGHLEVYLSSIALRRRMEALGLETCLATLEVDAPMQLEGLFNPLLVDPAGGGTAPTPASVHQDRPRLVTLVTGPNSGGKTRLLQSIGLAQLFGQSGLYVPAARARLPLVRGLFVSLVETETAHQAEGRLGRELMRIRRLFATVGSPSLVVLDELCSGTNPSEGIEIFDLVLRLLDRLDSVAFISTHFLDHAVGLERERPLDSLEFLQVQADGDLRSTYQFVPGVAETSLAAATAERLGVTFDELAALIDARRARLDAETESGPSE